MLGKSLNLSRRSFLFGAGAAALVSQVPKGLGGNAPVLYGDGIHDDTIALQRAFDGLPVRISNSNEGIVCQTNNIRGGKYLISKPIIIRKKKGFVFRYAEIIRSTEGICSFVIEPSRGVVIDNICFRSAGTHQGTIHPQLRVSKTDI